MMTEYKEMINAYRTSIGQLQSRIEELNTQIRMHEGGSGEESRGALVDRRYRLYQEIWELQGDIRMISEYIEATEAREYKSIGATA